MNFRRYRSFALSIALLIVILGGLFVAKRTKIGLLPQSLQLPAEYEITLVAQTSEPRELVIAANGDLIVGDWKKNVYLVPNAEGVPGKPLVFAHIGDEPVNGVALGDGALFVASQFGVWRMPYRAGDRTPRSPKKIARIRTSGIFGAHDTSSIAFVDGRLYVGIGASCDACDPEVDATRATIQEMDAHGGHIHPKAIRIRNPIALAIDPETKTAWVGDAGQDLLEPGHPFEIFDAFSKRPGIVDYGWPHCIENRQPVKPRFNCTHVTVPKVLFPAYMTPIGAAVYPARHSGKYAFSPPWSGGIFVTLHGSWHKPLRPPLVVFVPLKGDEPARPLDWQNPSAQWDTFVTGFQLPNQQRLGRPTGIAVGPEGSLFVADDVAGLIYRIRPRTPHG